MATSTFLSSTTYCMVILVIIVHSIQAFLVQSPCSHMNLSGLKAISSRPRKGCRGMILNSMLPDGAAYLGGSDILIAASRFIKDIPSTLNEMSDAVTEAAPYTLPDGSYTNAGDVAEEVITKLEPNLPPPYYVVIFAAVIFLGSAIQQLSLGNVFDDEEKSASSSGAVARRMNMRNRSFFKKK